MPPTYEYRCEYGHEFEREQSINDEPIEYCNETVSTFLDGNIYGAEPCGAHVERLISSKGLFILKGKTWAKDGYTK